MKVDVFLSAIEPTDAPNRARELAATGVDGLFSFEGPHDVFFPLVLASQAVELDLMTNVAIAFPRSPMHMANAAWDLAGLSSGRFRLGLGTQIKPHIEKRYGSTWSAPVSRMRDYVGALKAIFHAWESGERLNYRGPFFTHTLMTPNFTPRSLAWGPPPIYIGALGPNLTAMTAEVADGLLVMPFNSMAHFETVTRPAINAGLAAGGRVASDLDVVAEVIVATGDSDATIAAALKAVKGLLSFYGSTPAYKTVLDAQEYGHLQPDLNQLSKTGDWLGMMALIPDDLARRIAVVGTPQECAIEIHRRFGAVASRVCVYFPGYAISDDTIAALASAIHETAPGGTA